jgi:hypothetical protein
MKHCYENYITQITGILIVTNDRSTNYERGNLMLDFIST